ncbi:MAG: enoyl-CoA hydratase/isomerase family protein [Acidisphaera sp.]|nr:enoyl-CoA hydratase/isomerase family protein [Acidisphaera sp.]
MSDSHVHLETRPDGVAIVRLARPPVNALGRATREALIACFDGLQDRDDVRAIVLTAEGRVFCAGADIKEKSALAGAGDYTRANRLTRDVFFSIIDSAKPVIAAVNGPALGAGCVLAACCDMIFATDTAVFGMPEIDVGQGGGASIMQRILPPSKVRRMMLTGERVPAAELFRLGAVEACVPEAELLPAALDIAATIAAKSPAAVRRIRGSFAEVEALGIREGFQVEQSYTTELSRSPDAAEARRAFFEKRKPVFGTGNE